MEIRKYTKDLIPDVIDFKKRLREEEDFWGWKINEKYIDVIFLQAVELIHKENIFYANIAFSW